MGGGERILLVEDDTAIRQLVGDLLEETGYAVQTAASGNEALAKVAVWRPDLILLDKLMPDGDGTAFAAAYTKGKGPRAPIVALCAAHDGPDWARSIGAAAHVLKPFDIDVLLATVREQLGS